MLVGIRAFFNTKGDGAIGALETDEEYRRELAIKSREYKCEVCGMDHKTLFLKGRDNAAVVEENEYKKEAQKLNDEFMVRVYLMVSK